MTDKVDIVNEPPHYKLHDDFEVIDVIEASGVGFRLANVLKYILRADKKGCPIEDLEKAQFYLDREIEKRKENE